MCAIFTPAVYYGAMENLSAIYDAAFFAEWGRRNEDYIRSAEIVGTAIYETFWPKSLADIGSGCGVYSHFFAGRGVRVLSLDGVRPPPQDSFPVETVIRDLTHPVENSWGPFDVVLCLEVAEHIPEADCDTFLDNLARFGDTIVMSAAPPFQGGHHHVNEQPKRYWVEKMARRGFAYDRPSSGRLVERLKNDRPPLMWMAQHLSIYRRAGPEFPLRQDLPFGRRMV
jgi:hypothetical protein